jgi:hypothetical protein
MWSASHVGAQRDRAPSRRRSLQRPDDACPGDTPFDRDPERFQAAGDKPSGLMLLKGGLGMGVNLMAPLRHLGMKIGYSIDDRHRAAIPGSIRRQLGEPSARLSTAPSCWLEVETRLRRNEPIRLAAARRTRAVGAALHVGFAGRDRPAG